MALTATAAAAHPPWQLNTGICHLSPYGKGSFHCSRTLCCYFTKDALRQVITVSPTLISTSSAINRTPEKCGDEAIRIPTPIKITF